MAKTIVLAGNVCTVPEGARHQTPTTPFPGEPCSFWIKSIAIQFSKIVNLSSISPDVDLANALSISSPVASLECNILR